MIKRIILLTLLIILVVFTQLGCHPLQATSVDNYESEGSDSISYLDGQSTMPDVENVPSGHEAADYYAESDNTVPFVGPGTMSSDFESVPRGHGIAVLYDNLEQLLADVALAKFYETIRLENMLGSDLATLREIFVPRSVPMIPGTRSIAYYSENFITFRYSGYMFFTWHFGRFGRSIDDFTRDWFRNPNHAAWEQHGHVFSARFYGHLTEQEARDFSYAVPVITWQLQGNAISVSIQGMENIRIYNEDGEQSVVEPTPPRYSMRGQRPNHYTLYSLDGVSRTVVGYRWLVNEDLDRWQYVLEPGIYTFHIEGVMHDEAALLVRHFDDHEIISEFDYGAKISEQEISGFTITVTPDGSYFGE